MKKSHIQKLFDNINGGDCVDSASQAQEIAEGLLEACTLAFERLRPKGGVKKDFAGHVAYAALSKAIAKAEGK